MGDDRIPEEFAPEQSSPAYVINGIADISGDANNVTMLDNLPNIHVKIVAKLSPDDDDDDISDSVTSPRVKNGMDSKNLQNPTVQPKVPNNNSYNNNNDDYNVELKKDIDTRAPFASVKAAVSKFGGIVDWKAHREHTVERRKIIEHEIEKAQEDIPIYKKQSEAAEEAKLQVFKELETTKKLVEELKLNLERAQVEEQKARQESEVAKLRVEEIEKVIAGKMSFAARAQLEVAHAKHMAAVFELQTVKDELESLKKDYVILVAEKDASVRKANEAISKSKAIEKSIEDLTTELATMNKSLESAHAAHLEAEKHRVGAVKAMEEDILNWEKELKQTEEELERVNKQISASNDLKSKLDMATGLLQELKNELASYMDSKNPDDKTDKVNIEAALSAARKELEEVKLNLEKANNEVNILKLEANSLKSKLEKEKEELADIQLREGMAVIMVSSLESELERTRSQIAFFQAKEVEEREQMMELPKKLEDATQEADREKALADKAREELQMAKEEADIVKAEKNTVESRLRAAYKEIEAAKTSEKLALAAIQALAENESENSENSLTISLEEYYDLSKQLHEAEELANIRVAEAHSEIEEAKESELRSLKKLEEADKEKAEKRAVLEAALEKAERAKEEKLVIECELIKWRAEGMKSVQSSKSESRSFFRTISTSGLHQILRTSSYTEGGDSTSAKVVKKKKSVLPKIFTFLGKKKSSKTLLASQ